MKEVMKFGALALTLSILGAASQAQVTLHSSQPAMVANPFTTKGSSLVRGPSNSARAFWQIADNSWEGPWGLNNGAANTMLSAATVDVNMMTGLGVGAFQGVGGRLGFAWQNGNGSWNYNILNNVAGSCFGKPAIVTDRSGAGEWTLYVQGPQNSVDIYWESNGGRFGPLGFNNGGRFICYSDISAAIHPTTGLKIAAFLGPDQSVSVIWEAIEYGVPRLKGPLTIAPAWSAKSAPVITLNHVTGFANVAYQNMSNTLTLVKMGSDGNWVAPRALTSSAAVGKCNSGVSVVTDPQTGLATFACVGPNNRTDLYWLNAGGTCSGPYGLMNGAAKTSYAIPGMAIYKVPNTTQTVIKMLVVGEQHQLREFWRTPDFVWHGPGALKGDAQNLAY